MDAHSSNTALISIEYADGAEVLCHGNKKVRLGLADMVCFRAFARHPHQVISPATMAQYIGGGLTPETARARISAVRRAIHDLDLSECMITVRAVGYEYRPNGHAKAKTIEPRRIHIRREPTTPVKEIHTPHQRECRYHIGLTTGKPHSPKARKKLAARGKLKLHGKKDTYRHSSSK